MMEMSDFTEMFRCDTARISRPLGTFFLIIGWKRSTKNDPPGHKWYRNGEPWDFDYLEEHCIASGETEEELMESARKYHLLTQGEGRMGVL